MKTKYTSLSFTLVLALLLLLVAVVPEDTGSTRYFIRYDQFGETPELFKYFYDVGFGYYVDIGAYDPMVLSNSMFLYTQGWTGINMEASPQRLKKFFYSRPRDINLNFGISTNMTYATFYDAVTEVLSTFNP